MGLFSRNLWDQDFFYEYRSRCRVYADFLYEYKSAVSDGVIISWRDYLDKKYRKEEPKAVKIIEERFMRELEDFVKENGDKDLGILNMMSSPNFS